MSAFLQQLRFLLAGLMLMPQFVWGADIFSSIYQAEKLCSNTVNAMLTDSYGFVWIATPNGLCRYDGYDMKTYVHESNNPNTLADNNVHRILADRKGLWLACETALQYYDYAKGTFTIQRYADNGAVHDMTCHINSMVKLGDTLFAVDTEGRMYARRGNADVFTLFRRGIYSICSYRGKYLLGSLSNGIALFTSDGQKLLSFCSVQLPVSWKSVLYYSANSQRVYYGAGINTKTYAFSIAGRQISQDTKAALPDGVMMMTDYRDGTAFGTDCQGLFFRNKDGMKVLDTGNSNLSSDAIFSLMVTPQGNLWVGTYRGKINAIDQYKSPFALWNRANGSIPYNVVTAVRATKDLLYIGTDGGGLCIYDKRLRQSLALSTANSQIPGDNVIGLILDHPTLWLAVYTKGLVEYNLTTRRFKQYPVPRPTTKGNDIWTICDDGLGFIWVGGRHLLLFDKTYRRYVPVPALLSLDCASIMRRGENIWVGTNNDGIYCIDRRSRKIKRHYSARSQKYPIPADDIRYLYADHHGNVWFSSLSLGLHRLNLQTNTVRQFGAEDGLGNDHVCSICEESGRLWMGTENGLFCYQASTQSFATFGEEHIASSFYSFGANDQYGGTAYMGCSNGLVVFRPSSIQFSQPYPSVMLTALEVLGRKRQTFNLYGVEAPRLQLSHAQNFFTIRFAVPELMFPYSVHFSCRLEGMETDWRNLDESREVSYTNIPPGDYVFQVRCTGRNGQWLKPTFLHIHIAPPWYATWWAWTLWVLLGFGILALICWFYIRETGIKHQMQLAEVKHSSLKLLDEAKMDFYARATHELRTPVFMISAQVEELMDKPQPVTVPLSFLRSLRQNAQKLNELITKVIDVRKLDKVEMTLRLKHGDATEFCRNLSVVYRDLCDQKRIRFELEASAEEIPLDFDKEKLETILTNLVSNAFKYTKAGGKVVLTVRDEPERVVFAVTDNGIGILDSMKEAIFQNYFRTERGEKYAWGDGIGLSTVKRMIELHHGNIHVESQINKGTTFSFFIPKNLMADAPAPQTQPQEVSNPTAAHSILIIDDERDVLEMLCRNLSADFMVWKAQDGKEGLAVASEKMPDIIVTDLMMPNMDGMEFIKALKRDKRLLQTKLIVFTADTSEDNMLQALECGADAFLNKPCSLKILRQSINRLLAEGRSPSLVPSAPPVMSHNKEEQLFLLQCREVIDGHLLDDDFGIDMLADALAMSHSKLYKKLKAITGMSLIEFINDYKIYKAVELLRQGTMNVDKVREQCGFKDAKNFREVFKRKMGMTPKQYALSLSGDKAKKQ